LLYCFHYDPQARAYVLFAEQRDARGGVLTVPDSRLCDVAHVRFEKRLAAAGVAAR